MEREMALRNSILEIKTGSHLYGLQTPSSDVDYAGIFIPDKEYIVGFKKVEEVDLSIVDKLLNGKNSQDAIDRKYYEFRKYIKLALENNPNILEFLFATNDSILSINDTGKELLSLRYDFLHNGLERKFIGYATSQKKKMIIKKDNFTSLENAESTLLSLVNEGNENLLLPQVSGYNFDKTFILKNERDNHYRIGDRSIIKNQTVKKTLKTIQDIIGDSTNRKELIKDKGYDYKFGHHLIRLLLEGKELLETGDLILPLQNKKELMEIKTGLWTLDDVLTYADDIENDIKNVKSVLTNKPNYDKIEEFTMRTLTNQLI